MGMKQLRFAARRPRAVFWALLGACALTVSTATQSAPAPEPVVWGILSHSKGCVIFREYKKTKVGFFVVVVTAKSHGELEVVETDGYEMDPKVWIENEENMNELQRRAVKDEIRYVKIQDKYTPEDLETARSLCRKDSVTD